MAPRRPPGSNKGERRGSVHSFKVLLRSLSQVNFRNLETPSVDFRPGINALVGPNASGKTNLLEAAYLACTGASSAAKVADTIRLGHKEGFVAVEIERRDGRARIEVGLAAGRKVVRVDGQHMRSHELARVAAAVLITPADAQLVHGPPAARRHFLDGLLCRLSVRYALVHREYTRVVEQRNAALRQPEPGTTLEVWSRRLIELGTEIAAVRHRAVARLAELAAAAYSDVAGDEQVLAVDLYPDGPPDLSAALANSAEQERARGITLVGPHRDDLTITLADRDVQAFGSRGEARTTSLALRVAEYQLLKDKHGEPPVLLLDDFSAELDRSRRDYLLELAERTPQAIVTGTEPPPRHGLLLAVDRGIVRSV